MMKLKQQKVKPIPVSASVKMSSQWGNWGIILEILLLFTGLVGYIFCNSTAMGMNISPIVLVLIAALSFGAMILLTWYKRVFFSVLGGLAGLALVAFPVTVKMLKGLWGSILVCYNYIIYLLGSQENYSSYLDYMTMDLSGLLENKVLLERRFMTTIILLSIVASIFFALALFKRIPIMVAFVVPGICLVPLFYYGIVPHYIAFSVFMSSLIGCYGQSVVQQMSRRRDHKVKKSKKGNYAKPKTNTKARKTGLTTEKRFEFASRSGSFGAIIAALMLVITVGTAALIYSTPILELDQVRAKIDNLSTQVMNVIFRKTYEKQENVAGYMEEGELLGLGAPTFRHLKVGTVSSKTFNPVYLRYQIGVNLTEQGWSVADEAFNDVYEEEVGYSFCEYTQYYNYLRLVSPNGDPLTAGLDNTDSEELGYLTGQVTFRPEYKVSTLLGLPYGAVAQAPLSDYTELERINDTLLYHNDKPKERAYMFRTTLPVYSSNVYLSAFNTYYSGYMSLRANHGENDPYMSQEENYSSFVYRTYLNQPEKLSLVVRKLAQEITANYPTRLEKAQAIERYLVTNYKYANVRQRLTRKDGSAADSYDYINYFLFQNEKKEGHCTLFASSMVAMLREIGIPARLATGYYVKTQMLDLESFAGNVYDDNYHAWVEVYFEGAGWLPFDPTPDYGDAKNYFLLEQRDKGEDPEKDVNIKVVYVDPPEGWVKYTNELPDPTGLETNDDTLRNQYLSNLLGKKLRGLLEVIGWIVLIIVLLVAALIIAEALRKRALKRVRTGDPRSGIKRGYYLTLRLLQVKGFKFFEGELLEDYAKRADNLRVVEGASLQAIVPLFQKVLYSDVPATEEERAAVYAYVQALDKSIFRNANPFVAFCHKWILGRKPRRKGLVWNFL